MIVGGGFGGLLDGLLGWLFKGFNRTFAWSSNAYGNTIARLVRLAVIILFIYAGLLGLTGLGFKVVPGGFLSTQDRGYAVVFAQLPEAASLDRTQAVVDKISKIAHQTPAYLTRSSSLDSISSVATNRTRPQSSCLSRNS